MRVFSHYGFGPVRAENIFPEELETKPAPGGGMPATYFRTPHANLDVMLQDTAHATPNTSGGTPISSGMGLLLPLAVLGIGAFFFFRVAVDEQLPEQGAPVAPAAPDSGLALLIGLVVGYGYYWFATRDADAADGLSESLDDDEYDEEDEEEVERPRAKRMGRFRDATTDSLIDRPAVLASSGKPGDCFKAVKLLPASQGLAQTKSEKSIFRRVLKAVAEDCRGAEDAVDDALEELEESREEIEDILGTDASAVEHDPAKAVAARVAAQKAIVEGALRRTKRKAVPRDEERDWLDRVSSTRGTTAKGGRPRGASVRVRKPSGASYRLRQEKAKTKRGFKWRKEEI